MRGSRSRSRSRSYRSRSPRSRSPMRRSRYSGAHRRSFSRSRSRSFSPDRRGGRSMSRSRSRSRGGPNRSRSRSRSRSRISRSRSYSRSRSRSRSPGRSNRKKVKEDPYPLYRVSVVKALHLQSDYRDQRHAGSSKELEQKLLEACTLYVGNLSFYTTEEQVYELFSKVGEVKRIIMGLDRFKKTPCGFCFIEYYTREDAADCIKFISGTKLDDRIIRCDWDAGFVEGRQYGRGKSGGQVRDDYRDDFDSGRGGYGGGGQPQAREYAQYHGGSQNILNAGPGGGLAGGTRAGSKSNTDRKRARGESESGNGKRARRRSGSGSDSGRGEDDDDDGELVGAEAGDASTAGGTAANENEDKEHEANEMEDSVNKADADDEVPAESALEGIVDEDLDGDGAEGMEDADDA